MRKHEGKLIVVVAAIVVAAILFTGYITLPERRQAGDLYKNGFVTSDIMRYRQLRAEYDIAAGFTNTEIDTVLYYCDLYRVPEKIVFRVIYHESRFDSTAVNRASRCWGYMQLSPKYFKRGDRFANIRQGVRHLSDCYEDTHNWGAAVRCYASGSRYKAHSYSKKILKP